MKKIGLKVIACILVIVLVGATVVFCVGNSYSYSLEEIEIPIEDYNLNAIIATPKKEESKGVIIIVQGDGANDATASGAYKPTWEAMTDAGYSVLSWNKQGVGESEGNWLEQSMYDRADEVLQVIEWAKTQDEFQNNIGVWGASQAGWVVPKVATSEAVSFYILVAPAINWISQGEYHMVKSMEKEGKSESEIEAALEIYNKEVSLLNNDGSYEDFVALSSENESVSEERYEFIKKNYLSDSTDDLENFDVPVLLILGGQDINVNSEETLEVYKEKISENLLTVEYISDANHSMLKPIFVENELLCKITFVFIPKYIISNEYITALNDFCENTND